MKKYGRRIVSMLLIALMVLTSTPVSALAAVDENQVEYGTFQSEESFDGETPEAASASGQEETDEVSSEVDTRAAVRDIYVMATIQQGEELLYQNDSSVALPANLAQTYGFSYGSDINPDKMRSVLDVLVESQITMCGATPENIQDYLELDEFGNVVKLNGNLVTGFTYSVNGLTAGDYGTKRDVRNYEIYDGDEIIFSIDAQEDQTAPVISDVSVGNRTLTTAALSLSSSRMGTGYYVVQDLETAAPEEIDRDTASTFAVKEGANTIVLSGLPSEACTVYFMVDDGAGNCSEIISADIEENSTVLTEIKLSKSALTLGVEQTEKLTATTVPEDPGYGEALTWSSSDETVVKVGEDGTVTAVAPGSASVTAKIGEVEASCKVTVYGKPTIETTLEDGLQLRASRKTFDVIARDSQGNKIASSVKLDGASVSYNWDDSAKTSYTLDFSKKKDGEHTVVIQVSDSIGQVVTQEYKIYYTKAQKGDMIGYATIAVEATTINCGYIIEPVKVPIYEGENAAQALVRLIQQNGYDYTYTGNLTSGFYLSAIVGANASNPKNATKELDLSNASLNPDLEDLGIEWSEGTVGRLGEFDYASGSGWMYCLNNVFPNVGFADSYLTDGDVIRTQFTVALGSDIGGGQATGGGDNGKVRADKDDLTAAVASVNSAQNKAMLLANKEIKAAYDEANQVILDLPASQEKVDAACKALTDAMAGELPDSMELKEKAVTMENMSSKTLEVVYTPEDILVPVQITWTTSDSNVATVDANGKVTATGAGKATITASYGEWSGTCEITVPVIAMTGIQMAESEMTLTKAEAKKLQVNYAPENTTDPRDVEWSSSDEKVADVVDGTVLGVNAGAATITAKVGNYTATCKVTVEEIPITGIEVGESKFSIQPKTSKKLTYTVLPSNTTEDTTATVVSTNTGVVTATVNASGITLKGVAEGEADVIVRVGGYSSACHVTVAKVNTTDFEFKETPESLNLGSSKSVSLNFQPVASPDDRGDVEWTSSDGGIVTLSKTTGYSNTLKAVGEGKATITATLGEISKSFQVEVKTIPLESISLESEKIEAYVGKYTSVQLAVKPANTTDSKTVKWTSSDPEVLNVTSTSTYGSFTAKKAGTVTLTAQVGNFSTSCTVVVQEVPTVESIQMEAAETEVGVGKTISLGVRVSPSDSDYTSNKMRWSSEDTDIATVGASNGRLTGVKPGTTTVTATYDGRLKTTCKVTVAEYPVESVIFTEDSATIQGIGTTKSLGVTVSPSGYTEDIAVEATSSDPEVVTVKSASAKSVSVVSAGEGTATVTLNAETPSGTYTAQMTVNVQSNDVTALAFKENAMQLEKGKTANFRLNYSEYLPSDGDTDTITWESDNTDVATVSAYGSVKAVDYGVATITGTLKNGKTATCEITVPKPVTDLQISASKLGLKKGSTIQLDAIDFSPSDGDMSRFSWASSDTDVLKIEKGVITAVGVGSATVYGVAGNAIATCEIVVTLSEDEAKAVEVMGLIEQLKDVSLDSEDAVKAAREAYDGLTRMQKAYVTNDEVLFAAEEKLSDLKNVITQETPLVSAKSVDYSTVELTWKSVKGAEGYRVYRKVPGGTFKAIANVEGQSAVAYKDTSAVTGVTYLYTVRAIYTLAGKTNLGSYVKSGIQGKAVPQQTVLTKAQSWGYNALKVSWEKVNGADGYRVYRIDLSTGKYKYVTQVANGSTTSYVNSGLTSGETYTYKVRAYRTVDGEKVFGAYSSAVKGKPVPKQVVISSVKKASSTSVKITWNKINGATGYRIYRTDPKTGKYQYVTQIGSGSTTTYTEKGLAKNTSYQYKIRAYRTVNGEKVFGAYSTAVTGSTK